MTALRATFDYELRDLFVRPEALGQSYTFDYGTHQVELKLPRDSDDFQRSERQPGQPGAFSGTYFDPPQAIYVRLLRAVVRFDADISARDPLAGPDRERNFDRLWNVQLAAEDAAAKAVASFMAILRADYGQSWLGLSTDLRPAGAFAQMEEAESGELIPTLGVIATGHFTSRPIEKSLTPEDLADAADKASRGLEAAVPETLLADAEYLLSFDGAADAMRAVLMAAIACEVKVKSVIRDRASADQRPLVDFILEHQREVTITAAVGLFHELLKTTQGRSLKDDNRPVFKEVERLFQVRNAAAHRGEWPSIDDARVLIEAARQAFNWLDAPA